MKYRLLILFVCLNLASCAITGKKNNYTGTKHANKGAVRVITADIVEIENSGIIYGNIQTHSMLKDIVINEVLAYGKIDSDKLIKVRTFSNGNFIVENLKPGKYIISSVDTKSISLDVFISEKDIEYYSILVRENEAVYAGTLKIKTSKFKHADDKIKVTIQRSTYPTEKKILKHVSKVERNTTWSRTLRARMRLLI